MLARRALQSITTTTLRASAPICSRSVTFALRPRARRAQVEQEVEKQEETRVEKSAMELIAMVPPIVVDNRVAVCDGGSGPTGHPRVFINLDNGKPNPCGYCGLRFQMRHAHGHH